MIDKNDDLTINPEIVKWAREKAGYSLEEISRTFRKISEWEAGLASPTYPQLEQLSEKLKCPIAVFFFPSTPELPSIQHSFRTLSQKDFEEIPKTVKLFLRKAQVMQINLNELNDGVNPAKSSLTKDLKISTSDAIPKIAKSIRNFLGITVEDQIKWKSLDRALEGWRDICIDHGVNVFKGAFRANNFFGFCLYEEEFPVIYINNTSSKSRQIFTLIHELAHLIFRTSGIDTSSQQELNLLPNQSKSIEVLCNKLAAEILLPQQHFQAALTGKKIDKDTASEIADHFLISREVVYRRLLDMQLISYTEYLSAVSEWNSQFKKSNSDSGNYYNSKFSYLGRRYVELAFTRYHQNRFNDIQLADYLDIKPKNLPKFEDMFGVIK